MEETDILVIGCGVAGLVCALEAAQYGKVTVLTKTDPEETNTRYAQGGVAAVWKEEDSIRSHEEDTLAAGAGLCRREAVEIAVREGPDRLRDLIDQGVKFTQHGEGGYDLGREGGHSVRRVLHAADSTGAEIMRVLLARAREHPDIEILPHRMAVDLITTGWLAWRRNEIAPPENTVRGAYVLDLERQKVEVFRARVVALCTGGAGKVYLYTSNPDIASGDGIAMAWRSGAQVLNMEFIQFHPTCLFHPHAKNFLVTEAMRGEGGILRLQDGTPFMRRYTEQAELAPRDIVARAIDAELKRTGEDCVHLDMTHRSASFLKERFPMIDARCRSLGIDISQDRIPVVPAAHYFCGGIKVDMQGETTIRNLFAVGEAACTGMHGANRLASNSLLEALVFGHRAAHALGRRLPEVESAGDLPPWDCGDTTISDEQVVITQTWDEIRRFMWNYVGIVRTTRRLKRARRRVAMVMQEIHHYYWDFKLTGDLVELRNLAVVAGLVVDSALRRRESRGLHYNADFSGPPDPRFKRPTLLERDPYA